MRRSPCKRVLATLCWDDAVTDSRLSLAGRSPLAGAGVVTFPVRFMAVVFRPFKGEVLDAVVTTVNKMGFFAEVGPLQVFVSKHSMPGDLEFDPQSNPPSYVSQISDDQPVRIAKDSEVRLRLIGIRVDATEASPPPRCLQPPPSPP